MIGFRNREETVVPAAPDKVFAMVSDLGAHADLAGSGEVKAVRQIEGSGPGVGSAYEADEVITVMGRTTEMTARSEIVEYEPTRLVSWTSMPSVPPKPKRIQWWFRLTPDGSGTRVVHECEVDFGPVANVLLKGPYALARGGAVKRGMRVTLDNLQKRASS